ncbi:transglutaminase-like cysteine proteinase BTLCP [Sulfurisoma sediminicola]|uniref:Transglutaminase-like cysteine proteinase BTLCP n=1 Tax=Sulfurisoma sediminicola TaxID=1381557 RepID=A0A497XJZ5_9PROT|nr:transglutaminase-like cysteine proteinase BTLCP [Sulfurisoma sediminicola]
MIPQGHRERMPCSKLIAAIARRWLFAPILIVLAVGVAHALDFDRLLDRFLGLGGSAPVFREWQQLLTDAKSLGTKEKLRRVNDFFNRGLQFGDDQEIWGESDYWATLLETLAKGRGDCEDFTTAKYFTLLSAGVPGEQLRLVYVKAKIGGASSHVTQAHMVLAYYDTPEADPIVLDNLITELRPAARRPDLQPVFSFNGHGMWQGATGKAAAGGARTGRLSRWDDLLRRAKAEGFE